MSIAMLVNVTTVLLLTSEQPTTLEFAEGIEYFSIGKAIDFESYLSKNKKILMVRPKKKEFDEFLVVIDKNHSYQFRLKSTPKKITALYRLRKGNVEKFYTLKFKTDRYRVLEGKNSLKVERGKRAHLRINGVNVSEKIFYYPKNAYLSIEGKEVR
ncbi:MAG: hypothetical protein OXB88_07170 [Bacteriovoracales bacterium]|nr:hypothetical protein [Bacteriovoracales bacterium]